MADSVLKLCPKAVSLRFVEPFHLGRSDLLSVRDSALDILRDGVGVEYSREETPFDCRKSATLERESGVFLGMLLLWLPVIEAGMLEYRFPICERVVVLLAKLLWRDL